MREDNICYQSSRDNATNCESDVNDNEDDNACNSIALLQGALEILPDPILQTSRWQVQRLDIASSSGFLGR